MGAIARIMGGDQCRVTPITPKASPATAGKLSARLSEITGRPEYITKVQRQTHDYYENTYQFIDRLFTGAGWSRLSPTASRTAITIKGQARPGKSATGSTTAQAECGEASGPGSEAAGSDEGARRDE
jgi:hypothetical protein